MGPPKDSSKKYTLVLDVDETLVFSWMAGHENMTYKGVYQRERPQRDPNETASLPLGNQLIDLEIWFRPGLLEFLDAASKLFEVVIFSAGGEVYIQNVLNKVDPEGKYIDCMFTSKHLHSYKAPSNIEIKIKDISEFFSGGNPRQEQRVVIVDETLTVFAKHLRNVVPIVPFLGHADDDELPKLLEFLKTLVELDDVREGIVKKYNLPGHLRRFCRQNRLAVPADI
eukprot:jgi/Botrbrau1/22038/Bobra.0024s0051.2